MEFKNRKRMDEYMLLAVDVGNTNITIGIFEEDNLNATFRITTKIQRTSDEFGTIIISLLNSRGIDSTSIKDVIISSVVPDVMHSFENGVKKYLHTDPIIVGPGTKTGIKTTYGNQREIGSDRIVDAVAAYEKFGGPVIVIDYGTATTYDYITVDGTFAAGVTAPGIRISAKALWQDAARLPAIEIKKPESILAKETISSMQAGLVYGNIGQTEYIIDQIKKESGDLEAIVVATGGLGKIISDATDKIDIYDSNLTLYGLKLIYDKNKKKSK